MIQLKTLFERYESLIRAIENSDAVFAESGMINRYGELDFGFFPLGTGILNNCSTIEAAGIPACDVMVLGNDFGTEEYLDSLFPASRESETNATIRNLVRPNRLGLDVNTTFFTNLFMGVRSAGTNTKRVINLQSAYREFCIAFLQHQLAIMHPRIVIRLGKEIVGALKQHNELFEGITVVDIPHPSFAHINWKPEMIDEWKRLIYPHA